MRRDNKKITIKFILFSLLLIGVVYAILQTNLQINGTAKIKANTWDIHFDNIVVNENSVSIGENDSAATIDPDNNCKVDFEVTLSLPGDFYEFTIDVVNEGTIDGMIGELNKTLKVNNEAVSEAPDYLDYIVTYSDGVEIEENHKISAGTTETYLVRLEFKTDIEELPEATTISTSLLPQYIQADSTATHVLHPHSLYNVLKEEAENGGIAKKFTGLHKDSFTVMGTHDIYHWYLDISATGDLIHNKDNVIFAGFCWQILRTTDTGGTKLMFNGYPNEGKCNNPSAAITRSYYVNFTNSPAYVGYMYNPSTKISHRGSGWAEEGSLYGNGVTYNNGIYTLTDTTSSADNNHHYSCNNTSGQCNSVRYYYSNSNYTILNDGRNIEQALTDMLSADNVNQTNSVVKTTVDNWYRNNMTSYTSKLEDTIFCNDRSISEYGGWNPNGGNITSSFNFLKFNNYSIKRDLECLNETDQFSLENSKAKLTYPVGLPTASEMNLYNNNSARTLPNSIWLMTPYRFTTNISVYIHEYTGFVTVPYEIDGYYGVRPVISLAPGTVYYFGDGSKNNPYIVE
ncbi:MAG: hypothetical protein IJG68_04275 [Bacilli bacterium]|nr:hypothetical protein [Bacilli bacterium]